MGTRNHNACCVSAGRSGVDPSQGAGIKRDVGEAGSYSRLIDFVYDVTLGSRVIKKKKKNAPGREQRH